MKHVSLDIKENKYEFFLELMKNFDFVKIAPAKKKSAKEEILQNIAEGMKEGYLASNGKIKSRPVKKFIDEL